MKSLYISILLFALFCAASAADSSECAYTLYVKTSKKLGAGSSSKIQVDFANKDGDFVTVQDLKSWGIMPAKHKYFRRGNIDIFAVRGPCIEPPICRVRLTTDGKGLFSSWYCEYVEVTFTGLHMESAQTLFYVNEKVSKSKPTAEISLCDVLDELSEQDLNGSSMVLKNRKGLIMSG